MSVNSYANSAFEAANSAGSYANSAFITANTANASINTKTSINALNFLSAPSSNTQNTIFLVVDLETGTPTTRKMSLSVLSERSANFAFEAANSAGSYANAAFLTANSAGGSSVQSAFDTANASFIHANAAFSAANSTNGDIVGPSSATDNAIARFDTGTGKLVQNSLVTIADDGAIVAPQAGSIIPFYYANTGVFPSAATYHGAVAHAHSTGKMYYAHGGVWLELANITDISGNSYANSAFEAANSAGSYANTSFIHANSSFNAANVSANLALSFGATTILEVTNSGSSAYLFSQYDSLNNPNVSTFSATTLGFKLNVAGHPFQIRLGDDTGNFDTGLVHVSPTGTLSYGSAAQGQVSGTLFWRIPHDAVGNYKYRCSVHSGSMIGEINVANTAGIYFAYNS
jgi:hypothetical protein